MKKPVNAGKSKGNLVLGQEFFSTLYIFVILHENLTISNLCLPWFSSEIAHQLSWPTVRFSSFLILQMSVTTLGAIYHQPQELTPRH